MRWLRTDALTAAAVLALSLRAAAVASASDTAAEQFEQFCTDWMQKLAARERDNQRQIHWVANDSGVEGEYVGYSREHTCQLKSNGDGPAVPVGKIIYHEIRYQKRGASPEVAGSAMPLALDATEVTEIFRYAKGKWQY